MKREPINSSEKFIRANFFLSKLLNKSFDQKVFSIFKREYAEFSDLIFSNESVFLQTSSPESQNSKTDLNSHSMVNVSEDFHNQSISKIENEVRESKQILEYIDNPKKLWSHLKPKFRNLFFERFVVEKQIFRLLETNKNFKFGDLIELIEKTNKNSTFATFMHQKMEKFHFLDFEKLLNFDAHLKAIVSELFKYWFLTQLQNFKEENKNSDLVENCLEVQEEFTAASVRKNSKIISFEEVSGGNQKRGNQQRLEKVLNLDDLFK